MCIMPVYPCAPRCHVQVCIGTAGAQISYCNVNVYVTAGYTLNSDRVFRFEQDSRIAHVGKWILGTCATISEILELENVAI